MEICKMANKKINRLKIVLVEKEKTNNWLAEQLGRDKATISNLSNSETSTFKSFDILINVSTSG